MSEGLQCSCSENVSFSDDKLTVDAQTNKWVSGIIHTSRRIVPVVSSELFFKDIVGAWKVRWGIGRDNYLIPPGLYAIGQPDHSSPVLVSANYKLTFDVLRRELSGLSCWLLILNTKGINVWCAAGKGTFGTDELINSIRATGLDTIVSHRKLILPQLGAPGIKAHEVARISGFSVIYGPVKASDIKRYLESNYTATKKMRTVYFTMLDRLVLTTVELVQAAKISLMVFGILFLVNLIAAKPFGFSDILVYVGAVVTGTVITPLLLPYIPGRAFSWKGWLLGLIWTALFAWANSWYTPEYVILTIGYLLLLPPVSAFLAMNFTGSSTYTSFSGVIKEMKVAVPLIALSAVVGAVLVLISKISA